MKNLKNHTTAFRRGAESKALAGLRHPCTGSESGSEWCVVVSPSGTTSVLGSRVHSGARPSKEVGTDVTVISIVITGLLRCWREFVFP